MDRYRDRAAGWVPHDVVASSDPDDGEPCPFQRLHNPVARQGRARALASGDVERERQLGRRANLGDQCR